jgi:hypothetical protein
MRRPVGDPGQLVRVTARRAAVARETVAEVLVGAADRLQRRYHDRARVLRAIRRA